VADRQVTFDILARDRASGTLEKVGSRFGKLGSIAGSVGKTVALGIGGAAVGGVAALGAAMVQGVKDAAAYQDLANRTANVLKTTGNVAGTSVKQVQALAGELESLSGVDEELIVNSQNVLATFTNIRNVGKNRIFDDATKSALDMSVALGTDLQGASIQVGKALNDPIKGVTALQRVGVSFTQDQKDQIKALVQSGRTMDAQKLILGELNKEFGGAAKAAGQGFNGSLARLKDTLGDTGRTLGQKLLPHLTDLFNWVNDRLPGAIAWMGDTWTTKVKPALEKTWGVGKKLTGWIKNDLNPFIRETVDKVMPIFQFALDNIRAAFKSTGDSGTNWGAVLKVVGGIVKGVFGAIVVAVAAFAASFSIQLRVTKAIIEKVVIPAFKFLAQVVLTQFGLIIDGATAALGWIPGIGTKLKKAQGDFHRFADSVNAALDSIQDENVNVTVRLRNAQGLNNAAGRNIRTEIANMGFRANGGTVKAGAAYTVGERGPETFIPTGNGTILPNGFRAGGGGGPVTVVVRPLSDREQQVSIDRGQVRVKRAGTYVRPSLLRAGG